MFRSFFSASNIIAAARTSTSSFSGTTGVPAAVSAVSRYSTTPHSFYNPAAAYSSTSNLSAARSFSPLCVESLRGFYHHSGVTKVFRGDFGFKRNKQSGWLRKKKLRRITDSRSRKFQKTTSTSRMMKGG